MFRTARAKSLIGNRAGASLGLWRVTSVSVAQRAKTRHVTNSIMPSVTSAKGTETKRALACGSLLALCVVTCATYEEVPRPLGTGGDATSSLSGSAGSAAGTAPLAGTSVSSAGTNPLPAGGTPGTAGSVSNGGLTANGGSSDSGGMPAGSEGGEGGAPPVVNDTCPNDPAKTAPGVCGCGLPDADTAQLAGCTSVKSSLAHRYDFEGTGTVVSDGVGTAHGTVVGATLSKLAGKGVVVLTGGTSGPYVNLPNGLISSLTSATLEAWVTWGGGAAWQRIFDFGDSTSATPEDNPATGDTYLFLTAQDSTSDVMRGVYSISGGAAAAETRVVATTALAQTLTQVALVVDSVGGKLLLYAGGVKAGEQTFSGSLASINDVNVWLGRSQYDADPELTGTIHDFRVYKAALTPAQIATSFAGGPDPAFLAK
jgi:hypothetical protein